MEAAGVAFEGEIGSYSHSAGDSGAGHGPLELVLFLLSSSFRSKHKRCSLAQGMAEWCMASIEPALFIFSSRLSAANEMEICLQVMAELGMAPVEPALVAPAPPSHLAVQLDGRVIGHLPAGMATPVVQRLHALKASALALLEGRVGLGHLPTLQVWLLWDSGANE